MEKYNLTQTGAEVQQILNNATPQSELTEEVERAQGAEQTLQGNIDAEELRAKAAEQQNADDIDAIENIIPNDASSNNKLVTESDLNSEVGDLEQADTVLQGNIEAEELRAKAAEKQNADDIDVIEEKIPTEASSSNQLADKAFVNSSIASNTATYRGSFNQVNDLHLTLEATEADIATALASVIDDADNNDYCYLQVPVSESAPTEIAQVDRYKYNGTTWAYEYTLNNSGFTADQWAALNSAITSGLVAKLSALPNMAELTALLAGKQNLLNFDTVPTTGSNNPVTSGGVKTAIDEEKTRAQAAEQANNLLITQINGKIPSDATSENKLVDKAYVDAADATMQSAIEGILALIPEAATALNQLADKTFVNSSIATNTGTFKGTYNVVLDLELFYDATQAQIALMLASKITSAKNNDYCYVQVPNSNEDPTSINHTDRYKYNGTAWAYEYTLNNSGYTSDQWGAINSGITSALVTSLTNLLNNLVPSTATAQNKLADQAYVIAAIVAAIPACKGTFTTLSDLEAVASPKAGDLGIVRTTGTDGYPVFSFYQYLNNAWNLFFALDNYYQLNKPASDNSELATFDNGMGKYEIPKHIVNIGTELEPIYQNQLYQSDFQVNGAARTNTIYIIRYDYTLKEDITIPANCVLEFDGGSISGEHTITGNDCVIINNSKSPIFYNIAITNIIGAHYYDFFTLDADAFENCLYKNNNIDFNGASFTFGRTLNINHDVAIRNAKIQSSVALPMIVINENDTYSVNLIEFDNVVIDGNNLSPIGIAPNYIKNFIIKNSTLKNFNEVDAGARAIISHRCDNVIVLNTTINNVVAYPDGVVGNEKGSARALAIQYTKNALVRDCVFFDITSTEDGDAIHFNESDISIDSDNDVINTKIVDSCLFYNISRSSLKIQAKGVVVQNCLFNSLYDSRVNEDIIRIHASNCKILNNRFNFSFAHAILLGINESTTIRNTIIENNVFYTTGYEGQSVIKFYANTKNILIKNNIVNVNNSELSTYNFLRISVDCDKLSIIGNQYYSNATSGYYILIQPSKSTIDFTDIIISDNIFVGERYAIYFSNNNKTVNTTYIQICNNIFKIANTTTTVNIRINNGYAGIVQSIKEENNSCSIGYLIIRRKGTSAEKPYDLPDSYIGLEYFLTDTGVNPKPIYYAGSNTWVDATGATV